MSINKLFSFIKSAPTAYHATGAVKERLLGEGYTELPESCTWQLNEDGKYFVVRNGSSLIAFRYRGAATGYTVCASHTDSPSFKVKYAKESRAYTTLSVEKYGGMIMYSWLDRPLSVAGRVIVRTDSGLKTKLVNIDRDLLTIPSVAIHMNRGVNDGYKFNPAKDMLPLYSLSGRDFLAEIAAAADTAPDSIVSHDLFLYARDGGVTFGANSEFALVPRLDDLGCVFASLEGFLAAEDSEAIPVLAVFDNEETGSETKQGAASTLLASVLQRISGNTEIHNARLASSFMVSADNAHAQHPNHPELADADNAPVLGGGIVIKYNASQRYATDGVSDALFREISRKCGAKVQSFSNRADMLGGSTLGSIADTKVSIPTVDIGLPQLAMHSAIETCAVSDLEDMIKALTALYSVSLVFRGDEIIIK